MKSVVNGVEVELTPTVEGVTVTPLGDRLLVHSPDGTASAASVRIGDRTLVSYRGQVYEVTKAVSARRAGAEASKGEAHAPMPGLIADVLVAEGEQVVLGQKLLVLEAMKTQQPLLAPFDGIVESLPVAKGQQVVEGALLVKVKPVSE